MKLDVWRSGMLLFAAVCGLGVPVVVCGSGGSERDSDVRSSVLGYPTAMAQYPSAPEGYRVPPDRAWVPLELWSDEDDPAAAFAQVRRHIDGVSAAVARIEGCAFVLVDARIDPGQFDDGATAHAGIDVDLSGLATTLERVDRVAACTAAATPTRDNGWNVMLGPIAPRVSEPRGHFDALAERFVAAQTAARIQGPGVHPEDRRCVPTGEVVQTEATLAAVGLALGVDCRIETPAEAPVGPS